ncbi:hypothetical protein GCM10009592_26670 [Brachybacterium rhamnosum]|uniref:Uncharacterized protein n=1 Tax=Brachybacterium rhamnosum TaxID=173361 RepID=A0ABW4Q1D7_9MICO
MTRTTRTARVLDVTFAVLVGGSLAVAAVAHGIDGNWPATAGYALALAWFVLFTLTSRRADRGWAAVVKLQAALILAHQEWFDAGRTYQATLDENTRRGHTEREQA